MLSLLLLLVVVVVVVVVVVFYSFWALHFSISRWFSSEIWVTVSLLKSPGLFLVFIIIIIIIIILLFWELSISALADGLQLKSEWQ